MIPALEQIKALLWEEWDPIGVNETDCPKDEYDSYAFRLFTMINSNVTRDQIVEYLAWVETEYMGLNASDIHRAVADKAIRIFEEAK